MLDDILDFSPRGWGRVILWTVVGTIACVAIALYVDSFNFHTMTGDELTRAILVDVFLPICLAVPMLLFLLIKLRQLAIAHHQLAQVASTDSLTSVLNRGAFTAMVEGYLKQVREDDFAHRGGALLVIDADNFKTVNDTFGHDAGDEALKLIAKAIARLLRTTDLVGRIGGEEFAVFLPGSGTLRQWPAARAVGQRGWRGVRPPHSVRRPVPARRPAALHSQTEWAQPRLGSAHRALRYGADGLGGIAAAGLSPRASPYPRRSSRNWRRRSARRRRPRAARSS
jgi:GGDEF domain-containing protein